MDSGQVAVVIHLAHPARHVSVLREGIAQDIAHHAVGVVGRRVGRGPQVFGQRREGGGTVEVVGVDRREIAVHGILTA